jgi:hypothetical protein
MEDASSDEFCMERCSGFTKKEGGSCMYTSLFCLALAVAAPPGEKTSPEWLTTYGQAQRLGQTSNKPLAVFMAPGKDGWKRLSREGKLSEEGLKDLANGYVCCFLDTTTDEGKKWAKAFEMSSGLGVVLSDRSGDTQAYRHEGSLDGSSLASTLSTYSGRTVSRTSHYPAESSASPTTTIQGRIYGSSPSSSRGCST